MIGWVDRTVVDCTHGRFYDAVHFLEENTTTTTTIIIRKEGWKEGNVLFNDTFNTFYLWLYGLRHVVKDHSESERGNPLLPHGLLSPISKGSFNAGQDITYYSLCYTSCGALAGTRNSSMGQP